MLAVDLVTAVVPIPLTPSQSNLQTKKMYHKILNSCLVNAYGIRSIQYVIPAPET
jgi:hypothetical protein